MDTKVQVVLQRRSLIGDKSFDINIDPDHRVVSFTGPHPETPLTPEDNMFFAQIVNRLGEILADICDLETPNPNRVIH